ncbi:MAG: inner membrane-spanning protein YciB [Caulobacteraceae bacterium]
MSTPAEAQPISDKTRTLRTVVDLGGVFVFVAVFIAARVFLHLKGTEAMVFATWGLVAGSAAALALGYIVERRVAPVPLIGGLLALVFGVLTLVFHDPVFVKLKTTIINLVLAGVMFGGLALKRNPLKVMLSAAITMSDQGWRKLTFRLGAFYLSMAVLNEIIWRTQSEDMWVAFRFPGLWLLTIAFMLTQVPLLRKDAKVAETATELEP